jgi:hypothetical protein
MTPTTTEASREEGTMMENDDVDRSRLSSTARGIECARFGLAR